MICTVSTVLDSPSNVERFVQRNLAAGVDHMFIFLDRPQPRVAKMLARIPQVTELVTDREFWAGKRPHSLNSRQTANANLTRVLLAPFEWAEWLFHIDGDECLDVDRDRLLQLDGSIPVVALRTMEAVSMPEGDPGERFKKQLDVADLSLLHILGLIDRPDNASFFNGHVHGKVGIRPSLDYNLHIHRAKTHDYETIGAHEADHFRLLHYDAVSVDEFIRKWRGHALAETDSVFGNKKATILAAVRSVQRNTALPDEQKEHYLRRIYQRMVEDDVTTLQGLGFLYTPAEEWHSHCAQPLSRAHDASMRRLLTLLRAADKNYFRPRSTRFSEKDLLRDVSQQLSSTDPELAQAIGRCLATAGSYR